MKIRTSLTALASSSGIFLFLAISTLVLVPLNAEPYIAVRTGFKCSQCHVNISGGGKRTDFGNIYAQRFLNARYAKPNETGHFTPQLSSNISVGSNFRLRNTTYFAFSSTLGNSAPETSDLDITEGGFYLEVRLVPHRLTLYIDQIVSPEPETRESFGLLYGLPLNGYIKAGKILLPYGFRIWDDHAFIRESTGFTYSGPDLAVEIGLEPRNISVSMAATMTQFSGLAAWVRKRGRIGVSWQKEINGLSDGFDTRMVGVFGGLHTGRFTLLSEFDHIEWETEVTQADSSGWKITRQQALFAELDFLLSRGFNLKVVYELFDRNLDVPRERDAQERITLGIEIFPIQFIQLSAYYHINNFIPQNVLWNQDDFALELHFFF